MGKNIVFCADGTWNGPGEDPNNTTFSGTTNVYKLFCNLQGSPTLDSILLKKEQETISTSGSIVTQVAKYIDGVGDSDNFLVKILGGTLGAGIIARIVRGYTFISRNYDDKDDNIFIIGFSRGAYTARVLAGLISKMGLLDKNKSNLTDKENAYRLGSAVWYSYRKDAISNNDDLLGKLEEIVLDLPHFLTLDHPPQLIEAKIEAVAVWDTVGALGIPEYVLGSDKRIESMRFVDNSLNPNVTLGFHAVSIDEQRSDFEPTLWNQRNNVIQYLFPGAHADVGGGYPDGYSATNGYESGLSDGALDWIMDKLKNRGVLFSTLLSVVPNPHPNGTAHQPWTYPPWNAMPQGSRTFPNWVKTNLDGSAIQRRDSGLVKPDPGAPPTLYNPSNI